MGALAFASAFSQGAVSEVGGGLYPFIDKYDFVLVVLLNGAALWLSIRLVNWFITATRGTLIALLFALRDAAKLVPIGRWLTYWPLYFRFRLRHHSWIYHSAWWGVLLAGAFAVLINTKELAAFRDSPGFQDLLWLLGQIVALAIVGNITLSLHVVREFRRGKVSLPPVTATMLRQAPFSSRGLRLAISSFFSPIALLLLFTTAGTMGHLLVAISKYGPPAVEILLGDGSIEKGSIVLAAIDGVIFFPEGTPTGAYIPLSQVRKISALDYQH
ncbi:MAG: hypothetical protein ABL962_08915 [Fimbriimonadaceae bacterium]